MTKARKAPPRFTMQMPKLTRRRVWAGIYSEMTGTVVMLFRKRPKKDPVLDRYSVLDERHFASIWLDEWAHWFGSVQPFVDAGLIDARGMACSGAGTPNVCDAMKVIPIDLVASWDDDTLIGLAVFADL
jgi:hypothetical protein